ncbi:MAG: hypothetical protein E7162_02780 [Firmicutes bacterium]|nr:hypothetical protein [Bacillota bacterium]
MDNNQDLNFLNQNNNQELFKQIDQEMKEKEKIENPNTTNDEFIKSLPDWDLPPLYEKVRRVNRQ